MLTLIRTKRLQQLGVRLDTLEQKVRRLETDTMVSGRYGWPLVTAKSLLLQVMDALQLQWKLNHEDQTFTIVSTKEEPVPHAKP